MTGEGHGQARGTTVDLWGLSLNEFKIVCLKRRSSSLTSDFFSDFVPVSGTQPSKSIGRATSVLERRAAVCLTAYCFLPSSATHVFPPFVRDVVDTQEVLLGALSLLPRGVTLPVLILRISCIGTCACQCELHGGTVAVAACPLGVRHVSHLGPSLLKLGSAQLLCLVQLPGLRANRTRVVHVTLCAVSNIHGNPSLDAICVEHMATLAPRD